LGIGDWAQSPIPNPHFLNKNLILLKFQFLSFKLIIKYKLF
jgi:hypothetical protein